MLNENEIRDALHASKVIPLSVGNPHGPLGLEQLAEVVRLCHTNYEANQDRIQRPISLPVETWAKLDNMARQLGKTQTRSISASDLATALVEQAINSDAR